MKKNLTIFSALLLIIFLAVIVFPVDEGKLHKPISQSIYDKNGKLLRTFLSTDEKWRIWVDIDEVSGYLRKAVINVEDRTFYFHPGVNPWAIIRAVYLNIKNGEIISGGSTITMQVARMMEHRKRTLFSKFVEMICALKLEVFFSKNDILEFYFNMAPYGGNIEGVGAACYYYFQKSPSEISLAQAALLSAIPNSPNKLHPEKHPERLEKKRNEILAHLRKRRVITDEEYQTAIREKIVIEKTGMVFDAPHFTDLMHRYFPEKRRVYTTLEPMVQEKCRKVLRQHLRKWRDLGITNGAIVVLDNKTNSILALVGAYDFFDQAHSGQVNGAISPRSPGSTLKPFLYAIGIDKGIISPSTILYDIPVNYASYSPENYDGKYRGVVTVKEALVKSLNIPAVKMLNKIGVGEFVSFLQKGGISTVDYENLNYGLSMILGGCEVKLTELTNLYATLANGGCYRRIRYCKEEPVIKGVPILSSGATYIITELLSEVRRPDMPTYWKFTLERPKVAWKTGTSYGHRDAWSVGYTKGYTVGVWSGNFDGQGVPELVGAQISGPILFDVINAISGKEETRWFAKPSTVSEREVCATSGMVANEDCPHRVRELYLKGVSPQDKCTIHKAFYVESKTGYRLCKSDLSNRTFTKKVFEVWPPEVATWMERNGYPLDKIPLLMPSSQKIMSGKGPVIRSPNPECQYCIRKGITSKYQKILLDASVDNSVNKIFWFVDNKLVWAGNPETKTFIYPEVGEHTLVCQDDHARATSMKLVVR